MTSSEHSGSDTVVWLVEDNEIFRRGLVRAIDSDRHMRCGGEFECAEAMLESLIDRPRPDVVLLDVGLPGMDGLEALKRFRQLAPKTRVVILTVFDDSDKIFKAVCAGANGYLLKSASTTDVVTAIGQAADGGAPMGAEVAERVLTLFAGLARTKATNTDDYGLSPRETEVLASMAEGLLAKEIARDLGVSSHTVTNHIRSIYAKLHVNTNTGAVAKAIREGLV
ncbi:MAG: response regulator transcription factor [Planctomycetota bacterium]